MTQTARIGALLPGEVGRVPSLVRPEAVARLREPSAGLPLLSGLLVECPLGGQRAPVGVAVRAVGEGDRAVVARIADEQAVTSPAWAAIGSLIASGTTGDADLYLELDLVDPPGRDGTLEEPSVFVKIDHDIGRPPRRGPDAADRQAQTAATIGAMLDAVGVGGVPERVLRRVVPLIPASARLSYAGAMLGRGTLGRGCRLTFDAMPLDGGCTAMLRELDLEDWEEIAPVVMRLAKVSPSAVLHLDLDVTGDVARRIGFELPATAVDHPELGDLSTDRERADLAAWPRTRRRREDPAWPSVLAEAEIMATTVNHVKAVWFRGDLHLKAYLSVAWARP